MTSRTSNPPALGWLLLMPAVLGMLITLLLPTIQTIGFSLRSGGLVGPSAYTGLANYDRLFADDTFWPALGFTLSVTLMPLLVALVVAPLLALALEWGGTWVRRAGRILLSLSLVTFSPAAVAVSWLRGLQPDAAGPVAMARALTAPETAPGTFRLIVAAATFGVVCALAVMAFLPALRGGTVTRAMLAVAGVVGLATVASGLQLFTIGQVLTKGGPMDSTQTPALLQYTFTFVATRLGMGATLATVTGLLLGVLGVAATVLVIATRLRLTVTPHPAPEPAPDTRAAGFPATGAPSPDPVPGFPSGGAPPYDPVPGFPAAGAPSPDPVPGFPAAAAPPHGAGAAPGFPGGASPHDPSSHGAGPYFQARSTQPGSRPQDAGVSGPGPFPSGRSHRSGDAPRPILRPGSGVGVAVGLVALAAVAAVTVMWSMPWLSALFAPGRPTAGPNVHLNTWLPALAGALVSVGVAYLGALGIGALRPLGRRSEWLLLPFAPWLFVGTAPLSIANWNTMRGLGLIDTFAALVPPLLVSVPALLILTLLCKGLAERNGGDLLTGVVRPSLPMAGILVVAVTLVNAQDLLWPLLVTRQPDLATAPLAQMLAAGQFDRAGVDVALATPLVAIVVALAAAVAAQLLYLDRLALTAGPETRSPEPGGDA